MTIDQIKREVTAVIVEEVPEIMELKFGCIMHTPAGIGKFMKTDGEGSNRRQVFFTESGYIDHNHWSDCKILGRPITLADVLRAICSPYYLVDCGGQFWETVENDDAETTGMRGIQVRWSLSRDLDGQSDEVWMFLNSVICNK